MPPGRLEAKRDALPEKPQMNPGAGVDPQVLELARMGRKIEAIRRYRSITGAGLLEAREFVERL